MSRGKLPWGRQGLEFLAIFTAVLLSFRAEDWREYLGDQRNEVELLEERDTLFFALGTIPTDSTAAAAGEWLQARREPVDLRPESFNQSVWPEASLRVPWSVLQQEQEAQAMLAQTNTFRRRRMGRDFWRVEPGDMVLIYTGYRPPEEDEMPVVTALSREASEYLAEPPVRAFGTDAFSVDSPPGVAADRVLKPEHR